MINIFYAVCFRKNEKSELHVYTCMFTFLTLFFMKQYTGL